MNEQSPIALFHFELNRENHFVCLRNESIRLSFNFFATQDDLFTQGLAARFVQTKLVKLNLLNQILVRIIIKK
jgi:hypothetical protein